MYQVQPFTIQAGSERLAANRIEADGDANCLFLHGARNTDPDIWVSLRQSLAALGIGSIAFDFSGHGNSTSFTPNSLEKRYSEALAALSHLDAVAPRAVVGVSMSGEIAVRLAVESKYQIDRLVTIVGAAYDEAAFQLPFGPSFTSILRQPDSWRRSVVFPSIRRYSGRLTVVQAEHDTVVPHEIGQLLVDSAFDASRAELVRLHGVDHGLSAAMRTTPRMVDHVARTIHRAVAP